MISGKLPNNTIWWLSTDGLKIWIESKDLELEKFTKKGYRISNDRMFISSREVGELSTSRLQSRKGKDAWVIKLEIMKDIYPGILDEIKRIDIEQKKKKKTVSSKRKELKQLYPISVGSAPTGSANGSKTIDNNIPNSKPDYFDINRPYITWIKDEINKNDKHEMIISFKDLKIKMGQEFEKMDNFRISFGLNKILSNIDMILESRYINRDSVAIIRKTIKKQ